MSTVRIVLATAIVVAACASCSSSSGVATPGESSKSSASISSSPTPSVPSYLASYSADERAAYAAALTAHAAFVEQDRKFAAAGKTTQRAAAFYRRNSIDWVSDWASLAQLANNHVIVRGRTIVKWVRPVTVQAQHNMLVDLSKFPNALNLRRVLQSQAGMTREATRHAESAAPALVERFRDREDT